MFGMLKHLAKMRNFEFSPDFLYHSLSQQENLLPWWLYTQTERWSCFKRSIAGDILLFVTMLSANDFWLVNRLSVDDFWLLNWRDKRPNCHQNRPERLKSDHAWTLVTLIISHNDRHCPDADSSKSLGEVISRDWLTWSFDTPIISHSGLHKPFEESGSSP